MNKISNQKGLRQRSFKIIRKPDLIGSSFLFNNVQVRYVGTNPDRNPFFFIQDFTVKSKPREPLWLRGDEGGDLVQVLYNGHFKICTRATMELFGLQWVRDW